MGLTNDDPPSFRPSIHQKEKLVTHQRSHMSTDHSTSYNQREDKSLRTSRSYKGMLQSKEFNQHIAHASVSHSQALNEVTKKSIYKTLYFV
jgi:hypothetical protein